ncbi:hypothetical protein [Paenibacillus beijingensis]|uniref:Uncharacterized protein n=1 Tax=Paenibacillus beijingensis TaxID=1126833 RepID=A0A0D5NQM6_9BACL|nr:hypothetical protein [Paenibacillus beijingensis]AJY77292.1 hypothetical protein VN24_25445 [Paenibacillus beijingensis]
MIADVSDVSLSLFVFGAVFLLLIFSLISVGVLRMFQQRYRVAWFSFGGAAVSSIIFYLLLSGWFL